MTDRPESGQPGQTPKRESSVVKAAERLKSSAAASTRGLVEDRERHDVMSPSTPSTVAAPPPPPTPERAAPPAAPPVIGASKPNGANGSNGTNGSAREADVPRVDIDIDLMRREGLITAQTDATQTAEEFRLIKRPLLLKAFERGPGAIRRGNMIMVASSRSGEGKTFCSVSLAMSIALERDVTVLLIDADVARPDVPSVMGFKAERGLTELLADDSLDVSDVLLRTNLENLSVIPAGSRHELATELLASERMDRLMDEISKRYHDRIIIFDSPPVLMSSVAGVLALHVGQILFVVEADGTTQTALDSALSLVNSCQNISLLLNKSRTLGGESFGYYNYYYN